MGYKIRKSEKIISFRASKVIELDPKKFKKLKDYPFKGKTEQEFINYISTLDFFNLPDDLDEDTRELIESLEYGEMTEYANSADKGEDSWYELGEENPEYRKTGGFKIIVYSEN